MPELIVASLPSKPNQLHAATVVGTCPWSCARTASRAGLHQGREWEPSHQQLLQSLCQSLQRRMKQIQVFYNLKPILPKS